MDESDKRHHGEQRGLETPPRNMAVRQGIFIPVVIGASTAVSLLSVGFGIWALNQPKTNHPQSQRSVVALPIHDEIVKKREATLRYWNSLIDADNKILSVIKEASFAYDPSEDAAVSVQKLCRLSDVTSTQFGIWKSEVLRLSVLNVYEDLLRHVREEVHTCDQAIISFKKLPESALAILNWHKKKSAPRENVVADMIDSFVQGMMGRPFAGYEKFKADAANLDAEGQQLVQVHLTNCQNVALIADACNGLAVKEHQVRSELSKKYNTEFCPRPE